MAYTPLTDKDEYLKVRRNLAADLFSKMMVEQERFATADPVPGTHAKAARCIETADVFTKLMRATEAAFQDLPLHTGWEGMANSLCDDMWRNRVTSLANTVFNGDITKAVDYPIHSTEYMYFSHAMDVYRDDIVDGTFSTESIHRTAEVDYDLAMKGKV